jgi:hypothetical protein
MFRFRTLVLIVCVTPVLLIGGPGAVAGDGREEEAALLRAAMAHLDETLAQYASLAKHYVGQARIDDAKAILDQAKEVLRLRDSLADRLAAGAKARGEEPISPPVAGDEAVPGPGAGALIKIGRGGGGGGAFVGRGTRKDLLAEGGGATQGAVDLGLEWLKNHQDPNGFWDADGFDAQCKLNRCDGKGIATYDPGVTGLALSAFLGAGETHKTGRYRNTVRNGMKYLKQIQDPEGCFGPRTTGHYIYNHACAAAAMIDAYAVTGSPLWKESSQKAIDFIAKAQNPYLAWRYGVRPQDNDTSVTGWMVMALTSAKVAGGLRVSLECLQGARSWIDKVTEAEYGRVGYTAPGSGPSRITENLKKFPPSKSEALTAVGLAIRIFTGEDPRKSDPIQKGTALLLKRLPEWNVGAGTIDMYYWYYGSLAMFQVGGDSWKSWNAAMKPAVIDHQRKDGDQRGSWDPIGAWGSDGGRVYSTAMMVLSLETYYRYPRIFSVKTEK